MTISYNDEIIQFIKKIENDIETFKKGLEHDRIYYGSNNFFIDFNFFIELAEKYCFKDNVTTEFVPTSMILPATESKVISIEVISIHPDTLELFKTIFFKKKPNLKGAEILSLSYIFGSYSTSNCLTSLYYRFFYNIFHQSFESNLSLIEIFQEMLNQWNLALENNEMEVLIQVPLDEYHVSREDNFINQGDFTINNVSKIYITDEHSWLSFSNLVLNYKTNINHKIYFSENEVDLGYNSDYIQYSQNYNEKLNEIRLFVCALYLNGIEYKWDRVLIKLPWWFELKVDYFNKLHKSPGNRSHLSKETYENSMNSYSLLKQSHPEEYYIIIDSYFRFYQHQSIDLYFLVDAFTFFEALYTCKQTKYVTFQLGTNFASVFAQSNEEFWDIQKFIKKMYNFRSAAVHGSEWIENLKNYLTNNENPNQDELNQKVIEFQSKFKKYLNESLKLLIEKKLENSNFLKENYETPLYFFKNESIINQNINKENIICELKSRYKRILFSHSNQWEEINDLFDLINE